MVTRSVHFSVRPFFSRLAALALVVSFFISCLPAVAMAESTGTVTARVVLRKSADQDSKALQTLPEGDEVDVLDVSGSWYKVRYGSFSGYVMKKYISVSESSVVANSTAIAAIGDVPGALHVGDEGSDVKKLQKALKILGYYTLGVDGKYGDGTKLAVALYQQAENLEPDGIAGKTTITSIFGSCAKKADITVSGEASDTADSSDSTSSSASATSSPSADSSSGSGDTVSSIEEIGTAPSACKEGDSGSNVVKVQQALELLGYYSGTIDGDYGAKTVSAVKRFQKNRGMNEDGIAGSSTIRVLFGTSSSSSSSSSSTKKSSSSSDTTYVTETLDWFADDVTNVIPKKAVFTIKDVYTGKTFKAKRWSGYNHLDAEPLTAEDTATMKSIYGGSWSWNRRPILILYRGHVYAASMNGMPHGTTTISDNDFDGHFCIHFKNSKTHGTDKVDEAHQKAVSTASKATW
ncbi:MAG: peptidoglycan-binding protein [Eubacteriales bacterium]|nr:peptidoglycan-binding protein [Eubacteriales bacterium]